MSEALGHLHTKSVIRTLRCGPKNFRNVKRGIGPKVFSKFVKTSARTKRHSSDENWKERLLQTLNLKREIFVDDLGASLQHAE